MKTNRLKANELTGAALDWAVAKCEGEGEAAWAAHRDAFAYSSTWVCGGPIIEREGISILYRVGVNMSANINGQYEQSVPYNQRGNAQLIVAMRCYVASKLGDEVEVPDELVSGNI